MRPAQGEVCEVDYEVVKRGGLLAAQWRFVAWVSDPDGRQALARSSLIYGHTPELWRASNAVRALDELRELVAGAGWTELPRGKHWYSLRFERARKEGPSRETE